MFKILFPNGLGTRFFLGITIIVGWILAEYNGAPGAEYLRGGAMMVIPFYFLDRAKQTNGA